MPGGEVMEKFAEKFNENISLIKTALGDVCSVTHVKAVFKDWVSPEDHQTEIEQLKSQLEKRQPEIPEVPPFVADWLEYCKEMQVSLYFAVTYFIKVDSGKITEGSSSHDDYGFGVSEENSKLVREWFTSDVHNQEKLAFAFITNFYTVKEKRFYLKNKFTGNYLSSIPESNAFYHIMVRDPKVNGLVRSFTQSEIDSMETGSYEQIGVE